MHRSRPPSPGLIRQSLEEIMISRGTSRNTLHCTAVSVRETGDKSPRPVRLQTSSSGDAPGATALRSNFLGNAASSSNICTSASQTLVHGSMTIHDKVIMGPHRNEKSKNNAAVTDTAECIQCKGWSFILSFISYFCLVFNVHIFSFG